VPSVDFTGVKTEFEPMAEGYYPAVLEEWEAGNAKSGKKGPKVDLTWEVSEGPEEGRKLFRTFSLDRKALWAFKQALVRMGVDQESLEGPVDLDDIMSEVVGAACVLLVGQHEYDGTMRNNVKSVWPEDFVPSDGFLDDSEDDDD